MEARATAKAIRDTGVVRLEDGVGTTCIAVGDGDPVGKAVSCPIEPNMPWVCKRVDNIEMLQFAYGLAHGRVLVPERQRNGMRGNENDAQTIPIALLGSFARMGRHHLDIIGSKGDGTPRGPFKKIPRTDNPTYRCLWNNDAGVQRSMVVGHDCALEAKHDATLEHVRKVWATRGRVHLNNQIRYGTQRLIAAYTQRRVLGGSAWPNVILGDKKFEKPLALWCNSTFGIILYWFVAGNQQHGRGMMGVDAFSNAFSVLDLPSLNDTQLTNLSDVFDESAVNELKPLNAARLDPVRKRIDAGIIDVLGLEIDMRRVYRWISSEIQFHANDLSIR